MKHLRVMAVVARVQCPRCKKDFSYICLACNLCEECHLTQLVEDESKSAWQTEAFWITTIMAIVMTGVSGLAMQAKKADLNQEAKQCACAKGVSYDRR